MFYLVIASSSVVICILISFFAIKALHWQNGWKYWFLTCCTLPILLVVTALGVLFSFEPPQIKYGDPPLYPDPGPLNAVVAAFIGVIAPVIYVTVAVPTAFLMRRHLKQ